MHIGCGVYELRIRDRPYLYFWHYESKGGRRVQIKEYLGPAGAAGTRTDAARRCEAYFDRVASTLARVWQRTVTAALGSR